MEVHGIDLEALRKASLPSFYQRYIKIQIYRLILLGCFLLVWQLISGWIIPANWIASPILLFEKGWEWISTGLLFYHLKATIIEMVIGAVLGTFLAVFTGFIMGSSKLIADALLPYVAAVYGIPRIAMAPLFVIWFGIGITSKVALVTVVVYFLVFFNAFVGARNVEEIYINTLRIMGASRFNILRRVVLPHAAGWVFSGLRLALPRALIAAVVGEIISSNKGLGYLIEESGGFFDVAGILVAVSVLAVLGVFLNSIVNWMEVRTNRYRFIE